MYQECLALAQRRSEEKKPHWEGCPEGDWAKYAITSPTQMLSPRKEEESC